MEQSCENCVFMKLVKGGVFTSDKMYCKRYPPNTLGQANAFIFSTVKPNPVVTKEDWCGEWKQNKTIGRGA